MTPSLNIAELRREYHRAALTEADVDPDPLRQFERWLQEAVRAELPEPTAMTLATVGADGRPPRASCCSRASTRAASSSFTNYDSRKGQRARAHPDAALLFHWVELERQVRIEGAASKVADAESDAYFASRPQASRLGAWASPQSRAIPDRDWLEREFAAARARFAGDGDSGTAPAALGRLSRASRR